jgi:hypothetical protein
VFGRLIKISSDEEHYEAAGFVLDCVLANELADDDLGDASALRPTDVVRADDGSLLYVLCSVRPSSADGLPIAAEEATQVLVGAG